LSAPAISLRTTDLADSLARLARERGEDVERLRAMELLAEAQNAWPGEFAEQWPVWISQAGASLGLRSKVVELSLPEAFDLAEDGGQLITLPVGGKELLLILGVRDGKARIASSGVSDETLIPRAQLSQLIDDSTPQRWIISDHPELSPAGAVHAHHAEGHHTPPLKRLLALWRPEKSDIGILVIFAFAVGVLSLASPIAVESLVNTVSFNRFLQPIIILSILLFGFLAFAAALRALQALVVEVLQRRLFVRVAADLAHRLPRVQAAAFDQQYGPELLNRFMDVVTLQKVTASLFLDGLSIILATLVGMVVLGFYHPWLLGFDVLIIAMVVGGLWVLGRGAFATSIAESRQKYRLLSWFEDVVRCPQAFKLGGAAEFVVDRANHLSAGYLAERRDHFRIYFRQVVLLLGLEAIAATTLLAFGGILVVTGELTLGQLVAAELIVATILGSLVKLAKHIENFYDAIAATDKLGHLFDLPVERQDGLLHMPAGPGAEVELTGVLLSRSATSSGRRVSAAIRAGERVAVTGPCGSGKSLLLDLLFGLRAPVAGRLEIAGVDPRDIRPDILRTQVALVRTAEVFEGSILENVSLRRPEVTPTEVRAALEAVGLLDEILFLPQGLDTLLTGGGSPLTSGQLARLSVARAIAGNPRLLLIDGLLDGLSDEHFDVVSRAITERDRSWTLIVATGRRDVAKQFSRTLDLGPLGSPTGAGSVAHALEATSS
jgi:putative ABC transport system ATP-binding protein